MSAIKLKSKVKTIDLTNENDENIGKITFNPEDIGAYNELLSIGDIITKISENYDSVKEISNIPEGKLESLEKYKDAQNNFDQIGKFTSFVVEQVDKISEKNKSDFWKRHKRTYFSRRTRFRAAKQFH